MRQFECKQYTHTGSGKASRPPPLTPKALTLLREAAVARRDKYEASHSGNFERIYPPNADDAGKLRAEMYDMCLSAAREVFESHSFKRNRDLLDEMAAKRRDLEVSAVRRYLP